MHFVTAKGILSSKNGMNLYRGCTHGCIYCDSRSRCYHMEHAFEDIEVKENAVDLLEYALRRKRKKCMIGTGSMTVVWMTPILPFINDTKENISRILDMCGEANVYGVICFGMGLTLRDGNREYFKEKYIRIYGNQYVVESPDSCCLMKLFHRTCRERGIVHDNEEIFRYVNRFEEKCAAKQLNFWG
ncbi:hypothetical protein D3Z50_07815 [Clostridiaceae bacterium]|nr:hypothetical protein [Clostridiaceae bacterium]